MMENGKIVRISNEMATLLKEEGKKSEMSMRAVSKLFAKMIKRDMEKNKDPLNRKLKF